MSVSVREVSNIESPIQLGKSSCLSTEGTVFKRIFDLTCALLLLFFFTPVLITVACLVRICLGSPILFRQRRAGLNGKPFLINKFRTMTNATDASGQLLPNEERNTPFGQFLRSTSLDELPQLFNVLAGDLSLVGPRPLLVEYLALYNAEQARRHMVKPGITGWAQINGRNGIAWDEKFRLDVWYIDHQSLLLDLNILWRTFWKVIRRDGINNSDRMAMPRFRGNET